MNKPQKLDLVVLDSLSQKAKATNRICLQEGCSENAIKSHILQKKGILNTISKDGHLYTLKFNLLNGLIEFKKIGINNAFTFKGFCNYHDTILFDEIEKNELNFNQYKTNVLLCYRAVLNEYRKKEVNIDTYNFALDSSISNRLSKQNLYTLIENETLAKNDLNRLAGLVRSDIDTGNQTFHFSTRVIELVDLCTSSVFSSEMRDDFLIKKLSGKWTEPLNDAILNIIPHKGKTVIILGCHESMLPKCEYFFSELAQDPLKFISDVLIKNIETWVCSPQFYLSHIRLREKEFIK